MSSTAQQATIDVTAVDLTILVIIALSALISFSRGFLRELMSLFIWGAAILIPLFLTNSVSPLMPLDAVQSPETRATITAICLFVGTLLTGYLVNWIVAHAMQYARLGLVDRLVGVGFGAVRGAVIVTLLVLAANLEPQLKQEGWWDQSRALRPFQKAARSLHSRLPADIRPYFDFSSEGS